jgi:hypothetical protein
MDINVKLKRETVDRILERLETLEGGVEVGFLEGGEHYSGYGMEELARLLTRGFTSRNARAPRRPFIRELLDAERERIVDFAKAEFRRYVEGEAYANIDEAWERIGIEAEAIMKEFAGFGRITPGNARSTIGRKGFDKPWVDRGDLIGSIRYKKL